MTKTSLASTLLALVLLLEGVSGQQQPRGRRDEFVSGELLVKFSRTLSANQRSSALARQRATRIRHFDALDIDHIRVPPGLAVAAAVGAFQRGGGVIAVQPNYIRRTTQSAPPDDPFWLDGSLWGLSKIQAPQAWSTFTPGDGSVVIADIDTGVDYTHPDLAANMWRNPGEVAGNGVDDDGNGYVDDVHGIDTVNHDSDPEDDQGHGTHTAGTIAAVGNNATGVTGVNWNARLLACKFLDASGFGTDAGAVECFEYLLALRIRGENIRVSSNSWGEQRSGQPAATLQAAIDETGAAGIVNVFGAGNDGTNNDTSPFDPASYDSPSIIAVASSGSTDRKSLFSNYGASSVDLAAPGENIWSTYPGGLYNISSGTSMATPHVAGAAALLASMDPTLTVPAIKSLLLDNVDQSQRWAGRVVSGGRLNVFQAASAVGSVTPNTPPTAAITAPAAGATFKAPATIVVAADASDSDGSIRQVAFYANGSPIGLSTSSPFTVTWSGVAPGSYALTAVATDDRWATATSPAVNVTVLANAAPSVAIASPAAGAAYTTPTTVTIDAAAADSDGTVNQVTFYVDGVAIGTDSTSPYSATWTAVVGPHTLTATATDNEGATTTSAAVAINVNPLPGRINVALSAHGSIAAASSTLGANYPPSAAINGDRKGLNWGAGGGWNDATQNTSPDWLEIDFRQTKLIEEVNVFSLQDNYSAPSEPTETMTFVSFGLRAFEVQSWDGTMWVPIPGATVTNNNLVWRRIAFAPMSTSKIRVFITGGLNGYSRVIEVEAWGIADGANTPPSVAIVNPTSGAAFIAPATITVEADAADHDGSVQRVDFFANDAPIGSATASPYRVTWPNVTPGSYTLKAIATDNQDATSTSATVQLTVAATNVAPTVTITAPAAGATFSAPASIPVTAAAADSDGTIASVTFLVNGSPVATDSSSPFETTLGNVGAGSYELSAVATDNLGATATSPPVSVSVQPVPGRLNMALSANGGVATASSTLGAVYPASGAINGDRRGLSWGAGGGWNDGTPNTFPDWLEIAFNGAKTIDEVSVFSMQDNYTSPVEPTPTMTFTTWGLRGFEVQYWNGTSWTPIPGASVTTNNLVWRQFLVAPVTTTKIRVWITAGLNGYSRVIEVEAWGVPAGGGPPPGNTPPSVAITSPSGGTTFTAPATITIDATAADADGSVQQVEFFANGAPIGSDATSPYSLAWPNVGAGSYSLTAVATDNHGATATSTAVSITVSPASNRLNVALAVNGGVATASSSLSGAYPPAGAINGDRRGVGWGAGGGWNDGTPNTFPDWIEVAFDGAKTIDEVSVFSMQDNYTAPVEPTPTMTFTSWGLRGFQVQYWDGAAWVTIPGASITNNNLVWRRFLVTPVTTTKIRVLVTAGLNGYSRVIEVEAWGVPGG